MTRSILSGLLALVCVGAIGVAPVACQSGGVGDPCTPEAEYETDFAGFKVLQEFIESRSFQCSTRICLVNHFQGRVSCPYGQPDPLTDTSKLKCDGPSDMLKCQFLKDIDPGHKCTGDDAACSKDAECCSGHCKAGKCESSCTESQTFAPDCSCKDGVKDGSKDDCSKACNAEGLYCNAKLQICTCTPGYVDTTGRGLQCEPIDPSCNQGACAANDPTCCPKILKSYMCHKAGDCQTSDPGDKNNQGKQCCVPGSDRPINVAVCGQCGSQSTRSADKAVYCSCRCCPKCCSDLEKVNGAYPEPCEEDKTMCGSACDPNFNYCSCPDGFSCTKIRPNVGLGDKQLTGSYCIREKTEYKEETDCGTVSGYLGSKPGECAGIAGAN